MVAVMADRIGLALSGGGSRAIAFHLGCLRALKKSGILDRVEVISTVSGGSVIGALYALHHEDFSRFETEVENFLKRGLVWPTVKHALTSWSGVKALMAGIALRIVAWVLTLTNLIIGSIAKIIPSSSLIKLRSLRLTSPIPRWASRTTLIRDVLDTHFFGQICL
jgi:NTE family protein